MDYILDFGTGDDEIKGECLLEGEKDKINVFSFSLGVSQRMTHDPTNTKRTQGIASVSNMTLVKRYDQASPKIMYQCVQAKSFAEVNLKIYQTDTAEQPKLYLQMSMSQCIISSVNYSGGAGESAVETLTLDFTKIKWLYKPQQSDSKQQGQLAYEYDMAKAITKSAS